MKNKIFFLFSVALFLHISFNSTAAEIQTNTAQMQAMDKITGRVSIINIPINTEVKFNSLSIIVRNCQTRPPEETPENFAFVDIADTTADNQMVNIFKGWMLSSTPALNALEHPVYDVWLLKCINMDLNNITPLTDEELATRDLLLMQRNTNSKDNFEETNLSGEPIDLLPAAIREAGEESAAATDVLWQQPQTVIENNDLEAKNTQEENLPQSLLNIDNTASLQTTVPQTTLPQENKLAPVSSEPTEKNNNPTISDDTLRELEEELNEQWN